jgi:ureidoacrylate peracid hydrolase
VSEGNATSALVVIDLQNDFCHPDGVVAGRGDSTSAVAGVMPNVHRLVEGARRAGVRVVFVRTEHAADTDSPAWASRPSVLRAAAAGIGYVPPCAKGTWGAEFFEVKPDPDDIVVTKFRYSAFLHTSFELRLRTLGVENVYFCGTQTNVCVITNAIDALQRNFRPVLVADASVTVRRESHNDAVREFADHVGPVLTTSEAIARWDAAHVGGPPEAIRPPAESGH